MFDKKRQLSHQTLERRELLAAGLGPQLISVSANSGENFRLAQGNTLTESPTQLTFRFDGSQQIDPATLAAITIERSGGDGVFGPNASGVSNDIRINPGFLGFGDSQRIVIARFAETLPDDQYRIRIAGYDDTNSSIVGLRNLDGDLFQPTNPASASTPFQTVSFQIELGPQVVAVVPQPVVLDSSGNRTQLRSQVYVYFNDDKLSNPALGPITTTNTPTDPTVVQRQFYQLYFTNDTVENTDGGGVELPTRVTYDPALNRAVLEFSNDLALLPAAVASGSSGTYRLRIGSSQALPSAPIQVAEGTDAGNTFAQARDLGTSFNANPQSLVISGLVEPTVGSPIQWPGFNSPGVRDNRIDAQITGQPDTIEGINRYYYNFASVYGLNPQQQVLENAITPAQKQRAREILSLYADHLGVEFIETEDRGLQIVTGSLSSLVVTATTGQGVPFREFRISDSDPSRGVLVLDSGENWYDGYGLSPDARPSWFTEALGGIGSLLGLGSTFEQVPGVASGSNPALYNASLFPGVDPATFSIEPDFLSASDIIPGQALHRPETRDADLYRFSVAAAGQVSIETFSQRLDDTSSLNTDLKLWKLNKATNQFEIVARNDDFYSLDSFVRVDVTPNADGTAATYVIGVTASGNDDYNPSIAGSGSGGRSQGTYQMRVTFQNLATATIRDTDGSALDGDGDGKTGGDFNFWFRTAKTVSTAIGDEARTLFVDKTVSNATPTGDLTAPYRTISSAFAAAKPGDIVRILPSAGADNRISTTNDNPAYEIGRGGATNAPLSDGTTFNVPRGVTVMIDAGAILKFGGAKISVGSERSDEDRSLAALQILGTPVMVDANGVTISGEVIITSYNEERRDGVLLGIDTNGLTTTPAPGNWAGIEFRNDFDYSEGRPVWETEGIFLDYVSHADLRYGGGSISATEPTVTPLQMLESRPTLIHNTIRFSRESAMSADPNSFLETNFHAPLFQRAASFTSDYDRVGPDIRSNELVNNSNNSLVIRVRTPAVGEREPQTVSGRFDDRDVVHSLSEVLVLQGQAGGSLLLEQRPDVLSVTANTVAPAPTSSTFAPVGTFDYRVTFINADGSESLASLPTLSVTVAANQHVALGNLPSTPEEFVGRRLYRLDSSGNYVFVAQLDRASQTFTDTGRTRGGLLPAAAIAAAGGERLMPRYDARLSIDPGLVLKLDQARIEASFGADFYAEGTDGNPIVFTHRLDDTFGAGGTFDTNNDGTIGTPNRGGWGGLVFRQGSNASLDNVVIQYAGGTSGISGGSASFNAVEILQANVRIANSVFANNAAGDASGLGIRDGVGFNGPATIFVRGAQPIIVDNIIRDNAGAAISINPDSLNYLEISDPGRSTGAIDRFVGDNDNQGPLIAANKLDNNSINGMLVRNESLTTESVWDDTDIVHVVQGQVYAWNHHHRSGLRLKSDPNQSLVVKFQNNGALVANRYRNGVDDSIGGTLQVIGQPGFPVILTSIADDSVGAGFTPNGIAQTNTDQITIAPSVNWRGLVISPGANDRNVAFVNEAEQAIGTASGINAIPSLAQVLGSLAQGETAADENRRLGFNVRGSLSQNSDLDVYTFFANGGTEVHLDIDDTSFGLDTILELIDSNGNVLALSNNSNRESNSPSLLTNNIGPGAVLPLYKSGAKSVENPNQLDAGMRVILPGSSSTSNQYYLRVRSNNHPNGGAPTAPTSAAPGLSSGQYQLSVRLRETDEIAGSMLRLADIRFANVAIDVPAAPSNSPLAGEHAEELNAGGRDINDSSTNFAGGELTAAFVNGDADPLGSLNSSNRGVLRVSGVLGNQESAFNGSIDPFLAEGDLDVYRVDIFDESQNPNIIPENRYVSTTFDIDYADSVRANTSLAVYNSAGILILHSRDSQIADDQGRPLLGIDPTNLAAGSLGQLDAYIGPVELRVGTYYVVVSSAQMIPASLNQLFAPTPVDTNVRVLPVDSVRNIAEFGFIENTVVVNGTPIVNSFENAGSNQNAELPQLQPFFDNTSIVPYTLEDVKMFITLQGGLSGSNQTAVVTADPFTGQLERTMGQFAQPSGDLAIRRDGELFSFSLGPATGTQNNGNTGNYLNVDAASGASSNSGDDGLTFRQSNADFNGTESANPDTAQFLIDAIAFQPIATNAGASATGDVPAVPDTERVYVVGRRDNAGRNIPGRGAEIPLALRSNIIYSYTAIGGDATNRGSTDGNLDRNFGTAPYVESFGPASNKQEFGIIDVGQFPDSNPNYLGGNITGLAQDPVLGTQRFWAVTDTGGLYSFSLNDVRTVDVDPLLAGSYSRVINTTFYGQVSRDPSHVGIGAPIFSSVTFGPRATEGRRYENVLFATTTDGYIYTLRVDAQNRVQPAPVLVNGQSAVRIMTSFGTAAVTGARSVTGVAFSNREENPWHTTGDRNSLDNAHGVFPTHNGTRPRISGSNSLYFGFEPTANAGENTLNDSPNGQLAPGGVHGTTVSRPFSLEGYGSGDKPTLYFNYFLEVEANDDFTTAPRAQVDSFRVFATGDDGQWRLLATNNNFRSRVNNDEYDYFALNGGIPVQELHDDSNVWRQARVDLSPLAGNKNVQLRFDFSTAGGMQSQVALEGYLTEIQAVPGTEVVNGTTFSLFDSGNFSTETFEFVHGIAINVPDGANLLSGQQISISRPVGLPITLTLTTGTPIGSDQVGFASTDSAADIAASIALRLQTLAPELLAVSVDGQLRAPEATASTLNPPRFGHVSIAIPTDMDSLEGQSVSFSNATGFTSSVTLETDQRVSFTNGSEIVTVTSVVDGAADDVFIRFVDNFLIPLAPDVPATATFNASLGVITVNYNSNPLFTTPGNNDFGRIVTVINNLPAFSATLAAGVAATPFTAPFTTPVFSSTEVYFDPAIATPTTVAQAIGTKLNAIDPTLLTVVNGDQLILRGATNFALDAAFLAIANPVSFNQGATDSQLLSNGNTPIFYNRTMTSTQVRDAIRASLVNGLGEQNPVSGVTQASLNTFPGYGTNRIRLFEQSLLTNTSTVGFSSFLPGDEFGAFGSTGINANQANARPGENNNVEGLYIDDIVVGFAERGEVVLNAPSNRDFVVLPETRSFSNNAGQQPEFPNETLVGAYTLEIRKGAEYGVPNDPGAGLGLNEQSSLGRSFDTNDRLSYGAVTLIVPTSRTLVDGDTFTLSNGTRTLTFEFDRNDQVASVQPGRVRIPFTPVLAGDAFERDTDDSDLLATAIRDAINSPQSVNVLGVRAAGRDGSEVGPVTGNRIDLFGNDIRVNASSGRFLKIDLVAAETPYGKETGRTLPLPDQATRTVGSELVLSSFAKATATQYVNGATDTLVAIGKIGDSVGTNIGNAIVSSAPGTDLDIVKIYLLAGNAIDIDVNTNGFALGNPLAVPRVRIFNQAGTTTATPLDSSGFVATTGAGKFAAGAQLVNFVAPADGYYYVEVSSANGIGFGEYQLMVRPNGTVVRDVLMVDYHLDKGDSNVFRDQGQLIIESNFISNFGTAGIRATFNGTPDNDANFSSTHLDRRPGSASTLRNVNTERLLPGTVISNNVIFAGTGTAIVFSGEAALANDSPAPVPFGRIVNNTLVGTGGGTGIAVSAAASPTVLNNIVSGFGTGLNVSANSSTTIESANTYRSNGTNANIALSSSSVALAASAPLFQDAARSLYIPATGSQVIDSSIASIGDRAFFLDTVKSPVGISPSPIIAPIFDAYGIPRFDGASGTTGGVGSQLSIDRGAIDRADFVRPTAILVNPIDFIQGQGVQLSLGDIDPDSSFVRLPIGASSVAFFEIQLLDPAGTGPDLDTITEESVILTEDGVRLTPNVDYNFGYSDNSRIIRLTPIAGLWRPDSVYEITLNNQTRVSIELPSGDTIRDGDQYVITDSSGTVGQQSVFEFDSGFALQVPQTLGLTVLGPNTFFNDGDTFTITAPGGASRTFEINLAGAFTTGNIPINLAAAGTIEAIRNAILAQISVPSVATALNLAPRSLGQDSLQIGSLNGHTITGSVAGLSISGTADGVTAGDRFRYAAGPDDILFEFTFGSNTPTDPNAVAIPIARTSTIDEIGSAITIAIASQPLGLAGARSIGSGRVLLGGTTADILTLVNAPLNIIGRPGVTGSLTLTVPTSATAASLAGRTFTVQNGGTTTSFIFTTNASLPTSSRRIVLATNATPAQIASAMAAEINAGFVGALSPSATNNVVRLGEQPAIIAPGTTQVRASVNVGSSTIVTAGVSGGAISVPFIPTELFTAAAAAGTLASAISTSPLLLTTFSPGGGTLLFSNTRTIQSRTSGGTLVTAGVALPAIADLASNAVSPNRDDGETRFTIIMPEVRFDFGDAPASYGTIFSGNGARHSVGNAATPRLGSVIDTEADGQPSPASDDTVVAIEASTPNASALFTVLTPGIGAQNITINDVTPTSGSRLQITINGVSTTFELVTVGIAPGLGNIPVPFVAASGLLAGDTAEVIANRLAEAIRNELAIAGGALTVNVDPVAPTVIELRTLDDEDGIGIGTFNGRRVFLIPGASAITTEASDVLGFLNPQDPLGTNISVTVTGAGLLDAWIDFNRNNVFDDNEQVLNNAPVVDGINTVRVFTPPTAIDGNTWARFRLSTSGNLNPTGVAVGGEVEDYQVEIVSIPLPTPLDDVFQLNEDTVLDTTQLSTPESSLFFNDTIPSETFLPVRFFVGQEPTNGTLVIDDATSGRFTYTPLPDFYGQDSFTYRLSTQANAGAGAPEGVTFATVMLTVKPVNDAPSATPKSFVTLEDTPRTITANELRSGALADANPLYTNGSAAAPWDESIQVINVISLQAGGVTINAANANAGPFATPRGSIQPRFDTATGFLIDLLYTPSTDLNRNNVTPASASPILDSFGFTLQDDGVLIDAITNTPLPGPVTRLSASSIVNIDVAPTNDMPVLATDAVSVGIVGTTNSNTPWRTYFTNLGQPVPTPTEDTQLTIPAAYLLFNDRNARDTAADEINFTNGNDNPLRLTAVTAVTAGLIVSLDADGNISLVPPDDVYGEVVFTYAAVDQGINETIGGVRTPNPLTSTGTVTVTLQPINDAPVAFDRSIAYTESADAGTGAAFTFNAARLVTGVAGERPSIPGDFGVAIPAPPFNEEAQSLRVVAFRTSAGTVNVSTLNGADGTLTLASDAGGTFEFDFVAGGFTNGRFIAAPDYNSRSPFAPEELLEFLIADDGRTPRPQSGGVAILSSVSADEFATVTITVGQTNDAPVFIAPNAVNVLERDDSGETLVPNFITGIRPGPATALDEQSPVQTVSFEVILNAVGTNVPAGLMRIPPVIDANGTLRVYPQPDAVGDAVYVFEAVDAEPGNQAFVQRRTQATVTISVRPVNDPPRIDSAVINTSQTQGADEAWTVDASGVITFTMKEDNTGALGITSPYTINVQRDPMITVGYQRIGLLDVFTAGPANEEDATQGGSQILRLLDFQSTTSLGGTVRAAAFDQAGNISQLEYIPPVDFNSTIGGLDSFTYIVEDNTLVGGETFNLATETLVENRRTSVGTVQFRLNPVNDKPLFELSQDSVSVLEDTGTISFEDFAIDIFAGPPNTAFDETDLNIGQNVTFALTAIDESSVPGLFASGPTISPTGTLSFTTAPDAYGTAVFEVRATDSGDDNATRGDIVSSSSKLITINIRPINDRPTLNTTDPIVYTINEDALIDNGDGTSSSFGILIPLRGTGGQVGMFDVFDVGPANEAADITPGGNQSLTLSTPIPAGTVRGGILTRQFDDSGNLIGLRYTPRANFNGDDSFIYGVIDNGVSSDIDGNVTTDRREGFTTVSLRVLARNDAPTFGGAPSVTVLEDATTTPTIGQTIIPNWATNIQTGPAVGSDVLDSEANQRITFNVVAGAGNPAGLFTVAPTVSENGTLSFTTSPDANGVAVFTVTASDNGASNPPLDFNTSTPPRTFSITVSAVNDAPTFTPGANVTVNEDSGQYSSPTKYATNISPGPADEVRDGQTVRFEVTVPMSGRALFLNGNTTGSGLPTVSDDGFLRFTPADNVSGSVVVTVVAIDSAGARSIPASLTITIGEVNDVPVANNDTFSGNEDTVLVITPAQLLGNDVDPDLNSNPAEVLTIVDLPSTSLNGAIIRIGANGNIEYDPRNAVALQALAPGQTRSDTFTYRVQDAALAKSNLATVTVNVAGINDAPVLLPDNPTLAPTGSTVIRPLDNDTDIDGTIDPASIRIELQPAFGSLRVEADGTLVYTPFEGFRGQDSLRYSVADNLGLRSATQTITIDINQAPVAENDLDGTFRNEAVNINVAANDFDPDLSGSLDLNSVQIVTAPVRGTAVVAGGGIVRYLADEGFIGTDSFQYTIRDNNGRTSNVATVSVQTVGSRLQNPRLFTDVNASGETSPLDALLVINRISRGSQDGSSASIPVLPTDVGPDFYDVDGNGFITPLDALRVINQIARDNQTRLVNGEGESAPTPQIRTSPVTATVADMVVMTFEDSDYQVDFDSPIDIVVKAMAMSIEDEKDTSASQMLAAIDAAWAEAGDL